MDNEKQVLLVVPETKDNKILEMLPRGMLQVRRDQIEEEL